MSNILMEQVSYSAGGADMRGQVAWNDDSEGPRPGVLVVHEWWGNNDYSQSRASKLAELGYAAMSVDMYGEGRTVDNPGDATELMTNLLSDLPRMRERLAAANSLLANHAAVDSERIAAIGYCMGGGIVLNAARYGADFKAVASFHGSIELAIAADGEGESIKGRVAVYNGEEDGFVAADTIEQLHAEMDRIGADYQFIALPGAVHAFTNPAATANGEKFGLPLRYNQRADCCSWDHLCLLLESAF